MHQDHHKLPNIAKTCDQASCKSILHSPYFFLSFTAEAPEDFKASPLRSLWACHKWESDLEGKNVVSQSHFEVYVEDFH